MNFHLASGNNTIVPGQRDFFCTRAKRLARNIVKNDLSLARKSWREVIFYLSDSLDLKKNGENSNILR